MIAIIKGCGSNITSIQFALDRLGEKSELTDDERLIKQASHVILPGVGHANNAMQKLRSLGLVDILTQLTQPVLGICLGMQLLYESSEEGNVNCLGIIPGKIKRLLGNESQAIPHMGWNNVNFIKRISNSHAYFAHSYAAPINEYTVATTEYTEKFTSIVQYKNFMGMQFHPERSGSLGEKLLMNFIKMR